MRKVCEVYLVSSSATDERGVELTFPVSQYEMMDAFEQIRTKSPGDVYWQVDEFYCFDYLAPHLDESIITISIRKWGGCYDLQNDRIMPQLARSAGATEALKATDPMKWVGLMNACRAQAEEIAKFELVYV